MCSVNVSIVSNNRMGLQHILAKSSPPTNNRSIKKFYDLLQQLNSVVQAIHDLNSIWQDDKKCIEQFRLLAEYELNKGDQDDITANPTQSQAWMYACPNSDTTDNWLFILTGPDQDYSMIEKNLLTPFRETGQAKLHKVLRLDFIHIIDKFICDRDLNKDIPNMHIIQKKCCKKIL